MTLEFLERIQSIVEPLLVDLGFQLEEFVYDIDEGGPKGAVAYYRSRDCKIQIYDSRRGGEINCMIAPLKAANIFGLYDPTGKWQYLVRFAIRQGVPLEEVSNEKLPARFPTTSQWLDAVRNRIEKYYPVAHAGVLEMGGQEWWETKPNEE